MKTLSAAFVLLLAAFVGGVAQARTVTLIVNNATTEGVVVLTNRLVIGTNEVAVIKGAGPVGNGTGYFSYAEINLIIRGVYFSGGSQGSLLERPIAGPAEIIFSSTHPQTSLRDAYGWITVEITPESFPPDKTLILPEGTVGIVHVESSTNLINWQDEWTQTFSNTNQNRFFRIRAERSFP